MTIGGVAAKEGPLRERLESAYRRLATMADDTDERIRLVDAANGGAAVDVALTCPGCGAATLGEERFCEACGRELPPVVPPAAARPSAPCRPAAQAGRRRRPRAARRRPARPRRPARRRAAPGRCRSPTCGCSTPTSTPRRRPAPVHRRSLQSTATATSAALRAPRIRDHFADLPSPWVAAVCDRGIRHARNEDAMAVAASMADAESGGRAVLVVCDGVSSAPRSEIASLAAARAARNALVSGRDLTAAGAAAQFQASGGRTGPHDVPTMAITMAAVAAAADAASTAAPHAELADPDFAGSACTLVMAMVEAAPSGGVRVNAGWVGDSRAYWLPDDVAATAQQLTIDDSWAAEAIAHGMPREDAERMPQAHAITRWLGPDSPDPMPKRSTSTSSTPAGCWSAPTGCGTTPRLPRAWPPWCAGCRAPVGGAGAARTDHPVGAGRTTGRLGHRAGRSRQHHRRARESERPGQGFDTEGLGRKGSDMAEFTAEVFQNEFLPEGGTDVHAVVTLTCSGAGAAGQSSEGDAGEIIVIDTSGSMQGDRMAAAIQAAAAAAVDRSWTAPGSRSSPAPTAPPGPSPTRTPPPRWCGWSPAPAPPPTRRSRA